ncbi:MULTISPECIES: hypothetical protein [Nocardiopsidaceae]|uniref:Uncharacterized protein n=1 Tax=Streptomonospora nanhaiensis TaxID=1323731 RepID=A0ABY6YLN5_9ACTN|nr:hypothetical protein [Streptomonospora nanhaiensis]WAE73012.1 hypothetical protein OUQ99_28250 [Streptomonospora nanhaiensis]
MAEVRLEMGEHPLSPETRRRFPWARRQPPYTRAELNQVVAEADAMKREWLSARAELSGLVPRLEESERAARASAPDSRGTAGEVAGFLARGRTLLAAGDDPEQVAGYADAGRRSFGELVRLLARGVRPAEMRALNAVGRMRAGTETLRTSLTRMRVLCDRVEQAGARWPGGASGGGASVSATPPGAVRGVLADRPVARAGGGRGAGAAAPAAPSLRGRVPSNGSGEHRVPRSR